MLRRVITHFCLKTIDNHAFQALFEYQVYSDGKLEVLYRFFYLFSIAAFYFNISWVFMIFYSLILHLY